ncbi:MAG: hypothetical protein N2110_09825 [Flavobacteriales bacterium]|nr:hypothetical protein [Flavobacteriales bacterium]MCX7769300.1 hypothetical protein [Flavobacteriales bacterium]MDW8410490.1 hypothetical protein [Flavobacteriales bacterium]
MFCLWSGILGDVMAVPPPPTNTPPTSTPTLPSGIPLDGGVLLLAGAGAAYGARKLYLRKRLKK